jgi:hypothetical protein
MLHEHTCLTSAVLAVLFYMFSLTSQAKSIIKIFSTNFIIVISISISISMSISIIK